MKPHLAASPNPSLRPRGGGVLSPGATGSALVLALAVVGLLVLPASAQTWVARYDGPAGDEDAARAIAADAEGNVYVTGASWGDGTGNDYATVKYGPDGAERWVTRYDGPAGGSDEATAIAVRGDRVAVTGGSAGPDLSTDILTVVYDLDGNELWTARYNGPADGNDQALAITIDPDGNVIVAGYSTGSDILWDMVTVKYDPEGAEQWVARYSTDDEDYAIAVATDPAGNIYVTGPSGCPYTFAWDYLTIRYSPAGAEQWVARYNGPADEHDEPRGLAVDAAGNAYVTGGSNRPGTNADFTTIKYSPAGETLWLRRYDGPVNGADWGNAIALGPAGNIYVTGSSQDAATDVDYATVSYSPDGTQRWVARYDGPSSGHDEARAITAGETGVYVTGASWGDGTRTDYATIKYGLDGGLYWVARYDGPAGRFDEAAALTLDGAGGVCVTGSSQGSSTGTDYATVRYPVVGIAEPRPAVLPAAGGQATVARGVLYLPARDGDRPVLLDASGRQLRELLPGANDLSRLAPGVYFVRSRLAAPGRPAVSKLIIGR